MNDYNNYCVFMNQNNFHLNGKRIDQSLSLPFSSLNDLYKFG